MGPPAWRPAYDPLAVYSSRIDYIWQQTNINTLASQILIVLLMPKDQQWREINCKTQNMNLKAAVLKNTSKERFQLKKVDFTPTFCWQLRSRSKMTSHTAGSRDSGNNLRIPEIASDNSRFSFNLFSYPNVVPSHFSLFTKIKWRKLNEY